MWEYKKYLLILVFVFYFIFSIEIFASTSDGTIDSIGRYAWIESAGWLDFGDTDGNVHVTNSGLTGYAWGENVGWISLNCSNNSSCGTVNYGVTNTSGTLSGYAWGENTGWIDFDPDGGGVIINSTGLFTGYAWSENLGWINFNITNAAQTDWRAGSAASESTSGGSSSGSRPNPVLTEQPVSDTIIQTNENTGDNSQIVLSDRNTSTDRSSRPITEQILDTKFPNKNPKITPPNITPEKRIPEPAILPIPETTKDVFNVLGIIAGAFIGLRFLFTSIASFSEIALAPSRFWGFFSLAVGLKKRFVPWGTVYDSVTKQPIDPAIVHAYNEAGEMVSEMITDLDGRYGFLLAPGTYTLKAEKTHYSFPSKKLAGRKSDEIYNDLYFGGEFTIKENQPVVKRDVPLDAIGFDWNEFQKNKTHVMSFYSKREFIALKIADLIFVIGLIFSIYAVYVVASGYNIFILGIYVFLLVVRLVGRDPRSYGKISRLLTGEAVPFSIIRVFTTDRWATLAQKVADINGRYYCLIPKGQYALTIDEKLPDESYKKVLDNPLINVDKGIIKTNFKI